MTKTKKALMIGSLVLTMLAPSIASAEVGKTNKDYEKLMAQKVEAIDSYRKVRLKSDYKQKVT